MSHSEWRSYLISVVRRLPTTASAQDVHERLNKVQQKAAHFTLTIDTEYLSIFAAFSQYRSGSLIAAMELFFDSIAQCEQTKNEYVTHFAYFNIGTIFGMLGDHLHASEFLTKSEKITHFHDPFITALIKNNIGDLLEQMDKHDDALLYLKEATQLLESIGETIPACLSLSNIATIYTKQNRLDEALQVFDDIESKINKLPRYYAFFQQAKAHYYQKRDEHHAAKAAFLSSISEIIKCGHDYYHAEMLLDYCQYLASQNDQQELETQLVSGLTIAKNVGTDKLIDGFNELLLSTIKSIDSVYKREESYKLILTAFSASRKNAINRETEYLSQIYKLNMARLQLESFSDLSSNLSRINAIGQYISTSKNLKHVLPQLSKDLEHLFPTDNIAIGFHDETTNVINVNYIFEENQIHDPYIIDCEHTPSFMNHCIRTNQPLHFNDMSAQQKKELLGEKAIHDHQFHSLMFAPISINNTTNAVFTIQAKEAFQYKSFHYELFLQLTNYLSIALENQQNRQKLTLLSTTDHLTQLFNRQHLDEQFKNLSLTSTTSLTAIMLDIDFYKEFNDQYGHVDGDKVLVTISQLIKRFCNPLDGQAYRYGGDEFFILIPNQKEKSIMVGLNEMVSELYSLNITNQDSQCSNRVSLSIGVAHIGTSISALTLNQVLSFADKALYQAKEAGRDRIIEILY